MTENKRFTILYEIEENPMEWDLIDNQEDCLIVTGNGKVICDLLNELNDENEQLKNRLKDWHQRTFKAHEYFNILEKVIDDVCSDEMCNQIWAEYEKKEKELEE